jgi:peptidoglycan-N-acetylglucosamine deacetylase
VGQLQNVLDALKSSQTVADFFARGDKAESSTSLVTKISEAGFPVYNLSYSYPHFNDLPESGVTEQLTKADTAISKETGKTTKPFFRPPYGDTLDSDIFDAVKAAGYCPVTWSIDAMDWSADYTAEQSKERVLSKVANGSIIVMQASNSTTAEIVADVISQLKTKGYTFVHLEELLK